MNEYVCDTRYLKEVENQCAGQIIKNTAEIKRNQAIKKEKQIPIGERFSTTCTCSKVRNIITFQDPSLPKFGIKPL
jgi:hypothetical protein